MRLEIPATAGWSPVKRCTSFSPTQPNTNGISSAWQLPSRPPSAGERQVNRYAYVAG